MGLRSRRRGRVSDCLTAWLRQLPFSSEPILYSYLQIVGSLLCFTYAANAMVRFRGTHDRLTLILAFGFVLSGVIETVATFNFYDILASGAAGADACAPGLDGQPDTARLWC